MITRQACANAEGAFEPVGSPLVNADGKDYEYNLYKTATSRYPQSPSAGMNCCALGALSTLNMKPWFLLMPLMDDRKLSRWTRCCEPSRSNC